MTEYKSSYLTAATDLTLHTVLFGSTLYIQQLSNPIFRILLIPLVSLFMMRSFIIYHDCCHGSYTPNKRLNYIIAHLTGAFTASSPNWFLDHNTHHKTSGNLHNEYNYAFNETIMVTKAQYNKMNNKWLFRIYKHPLFFFSVIPIFYFFIAQRFLYILKKLRKPAKYEKSITAIVMDHAINNIMNLAIFYTMYRHGLFAHYMASFIMGASAAFMLFHNQHTFNPAYVVRDGWSQLDSGMHGSSFVQVPWPLSYFFMGIQYHHIHHVNAKIPGYNMEEYHKEDRFWNVHQITGTEFFSNLWLTLYDEETKRYVALE